MYSYTFAPDKKVELIPKISQSCIIGQQKTKRLHSLEFKIKSDIKLLQTPAVLKTSLAYCPKDNQGPSLFLPKNSWTVNCAYYILCYYAICLGQEKDYGSRSALDPTGTTKRSIRFPLEYWSQHSFIRELRQGGTSTVWHCFFPLHACTISSSYDHESGHVCIIKWTTPPSPSCMHVTTERQPERQENV